MLSIRNSKSYWLANFAFELILFLQKGTSMRPSSILLIMPTVLWVAVSRSILFYTLIVNTQEQHISFSNTRLIIAICTCNTYNSTMNLLLQLILKNICTRRFRSFPVIDQTRTDLSKDAQKPFVCEQLGAPFAISQTTQSSCRCFFFSHPPFRKY